jgi:hypothetical protein
LGNISHSLVLSSGEEVSLLARWALRQVEDRRQKTGENIGIVEDWNNGMMGLRAKNILIIISSVDLYLCL